MPPAGSGADVATKVIRGIAGLNRTLNSLPKVAQARIRDASVAIAADVAQDAQQRARSGSRGVAKVARHVAPTIRATRDRVPVVRMGGSKKLPTSGSGWTHSRSGPGQTVGDVMWGAEYGSDRSPQFSPWGGNDESAGYFLWPSVRMDEIEERYAEALVDACEDA